MKTLLTIIYAIFIVAVIVAGSLAWYDVLFTEPRKGQVSEAQARKRLLRSICDLESRVQYLETDYVFKTNFYRAVVAPLVHQAIDERLEELNAKR